MLRIATSSFCISCHRMRLLIAHSASSSTVTPSLRRAENQQTVTSLYDPSVDVPKIRKLKGWLLAAEAARPEPRRPPEARSGLEGRRGLPEGAGLQHRGAPGPALRPGGVPAASASVLCCSAEELRRLVLRCPPSWAGTRD